MTPHHLHALAAAWSLCAGWAARAGRAAAGSEDEHERVAELRECQAPVKVLGGDVR